MESDPQLWETAVSVGRWANIILGTAGLLILPLAVRGWRRRSAGNRFLWLGVALFLANTVYGTAEQLHSHVTGGFRVAVTTVAAGYVLAGMIMKWRGRWHENDRPFGGSSDTDR